MGRHGQAAPVTRRRKVIRHCERLLCIGIAFAIAYFLSEWAVTTAAVMSLGHIVFGFTSVERDL